jgi:hypothetical protein
MRGKNFSTGLRGVLFEARHYERMGAAVWLYGWLVLRQTHQQGSVGWVLGGAPVSYREIEEETGFNCRTLERWMQTLRQQGYIETEAAPAGIIIRITKAKKFPQAGRRFAEGVCKLAERVPQSRGAIDQQVFSHQQCADGIGSSSVDRSPERNQREIHRDFHKQPSHQKDQIPLQNHSGLDRRQDPRPNPEANSQPGTLPYRQQDLYLEMRLRQQLLRAERGEAVRRELAVGTGPEIQRP